MGYTTDFFGKFKITPTLERKHNVYLVAFNETRRMKRDSSIVETLDDPVRKEVKLPVGIEGEYFVNGYGFKGQSHDESIIDYNTPPETQPALWCKWIPSECGNFIEWDLAEKFYNYIEWLQYIINNFLKRWEYSLNGVVEWQGEDYDDIGKIIVEDNIISIKLGKIVYE